MIKSLSPYYINIPFVSPLTGLTCSEYTLQLFIWNGLKTSPPATASYQITKTNPTSSTGVDEIDISNLISDFIDFKINFSNTTSLVNSENQLWIKWQTFYKTSDPFDLESPSNVTINLMNKGYGYGLDSENSDVPTNNILLGGNEFKVSRSGFFSVGLKAIETEEYLLASDDYRKLALPPLSHGYVNVLLNDNLGIEPTSIIAVTNTYSSDIISFSIELNQIKVSTGSSFVTGIYECSYTIQDSTMSTSTAVLKISGVNTLE